MRHAVHSLRHQLNKHFQKYNLLQFIGNDGAAREKREEREVGSRVARCLLCCVVKYCGQRSECAVAVKPTSKKFKRKTDAARDARTDRGFEAERREPGERSRVNRKDERAPLGERIAAHWNAAPPTGSDASPARQKPGRSTQTSTSRRARNEHHEAQANLDKVQDETVESIGRTAQSATASLYGVKPVLEALRAGVRPLERIFIAEGAQDSRIGEILERARAAGVPVNRVPRSVVDKLVLAPGESNDRARVVNHQGVAATIAAARYLDADELIAKLVAESQAGSPALAIVLDGVEDPRNLGAIIRTVECAGAHGVFLPERRAAGLTETVAKTAAGALEYVPVARTGNIAALLEEMKAHNIWTIGTAADAKLDYTRWDWRQPSALVLGGEGAGLRRLVRERCDALVSIPLRGHIESLNVSVAAGIVLYEALRQRTVGS